VHWEYREKPLMSFELNMKLSGQRREYISIAKAQMGSLLAYIRDVLTHIEYLWKIVRSKPQKALEFGCGTGFHSCFISKFVRELVCLDLDVRTIKIARQI
jgi:protein-L-isoaspartate O-methyltransferase